MVTLPLGEPERCAHELERALDLYGARSALLPATAGGRPLDTGAFDDMFAVAERRGILLFLHPVSAEPPSRFPVYALQLVVQWPAETSFAVARMIFGGFLDRFPRLKILLAHGGGGLLFLKGRLNSAYEARGAEADPYFTSKIAKPPGDYLGQLYFDTCSQSPELVEFTIRLAGPDRVMFGTDYPFEIGDPEGAPGASGACRPAAGHQAEDISRQRRGGPRRGAPHVASARVSVSNGVIRDGASSAGPGIHNHSLGLWIPGSPPPKRGSVYAPTRCTVPTAT